VTVTPNPPPSIDLARIRRTVDRARAAGQRSLLEPDARELLEAMGIAVPAASFVRLAAGGPDTAAIDDVVLEPGIDRVVVRVVAPDVVHKTEIGGVAVVTRDRDAILAAMRGMIERLAGRDVVGFLVAAFVDHEPDLGGSLLVSARWTPDVGAVVTVGVGGVDAEAIARDLRRDRAVALLSPSLTAGDDVEAVLRGSVAVRLATGDRRGQPPRLPMPALVDVVERFLALAEACLPADLTSLEINPLVISRNGGGLVALDVLGEVGSGSSPVDPVAGRPVGKLDRLLEPRSVALIGVSAGMNPGHIILRNLLRDGFDPGRITVVKPGIDVIDGCACVPDVASLRGPVDLFVVAVAAAHAAEVVAEVVERDAAQAILVIPGGFEEKQGSEAIVGRMRVALSTARSRPGGGPLLNGGNCLGFRSVPGRVDTMFIPPTKLPGPSGPPAPLAIVAQSGAFAITRLGRLADLHPRYLVTVGNQMDLTVGDHVAHLAEDPSIRVFGVYVEGFRPLDARRLIEAAGRIRARGGTVVLSPAGRAPAAAAASASHTASIAGDVTAIRALASQAGVLIADTLEQFDDLVRTATLLDGRAVAGRRLGAISNAGFECVAIGDNLGSLELAPFDAPTTARLGELLATAGAGGVVDVHNPIDATPMADDAAFAALTAAVLGADTVDVGVVGVVPLTAALGTLPSGPDHDEDLAAPGAIAPRLVDLWRATSKAWIATVDGGPLYEPLIAALEASGIPVFRTADRAMRALDAIVGHRLG
jgi:acyl-CoA synthetase (NDP forming)